MASYVRRSASEPTYIGTMMKTAAQGCSAECESAEVGWFWISVAKVVIGLNRGRLEFLCPTRSKKIDSTEYV